MHKHRLFFSSLCKPKWHLFTFKDKSPCVIREALMLCVILVLKTLPSPTVLKCLSSQSAGWTPSEVCCWWCDCWNVSCNYYHEFMVGIHKLTLKKVLEERTHVYPPHLMSKLHLCDLLLELTCTPHMADCFMILWLHPPDLS